MIVHVVGARPNMMKAAAVLKHRDDMVVNTGQHWNTGGLGFRADLNLDLRVSNVATLWQIVAGELHRLKPDKVVVYGDVNTTLAAALAATHLNIPVAHVEAGLRSWDMSMPEEVNRRAVDAVATQWFTTEPDAVKNLSGLGDYVGNPMIDTLAELDLERTVTGPAVLTLHRPGNVDDPKRAEAIVDAVNKLTVDHRILAVLHPRSQHLNFECDTTGPMPYRQFLEAVARAPFVITDSGGLQEETTWLGVPCFTVRDNTERPVTVTLGSNRLVKPETLYSAVDGLWPQTRQIPPLWDGHAGERVAALL